ncbi:putative ABC transport system permease protein [Prauserella shujinwangii]|uniref:Putative ABC transport system permease protein n=1 Tax=Prauserella shujinwangii TaxID=1453103 RepID=A0A2T0LTQ7_9PSEU|nr:FtsX-like permease family protein [Prauserella shujinwangii]PRX47120.1 putative ABC transport system permease protein [Prauserella shujinwangii]
MLRLSWSTFRERGQLFVGALLTVCLGVALVQSSLLILLAAATGGYVEAITLLGMTLAIATFLAVFIVASTFAFTVAQRRRDLALLRLAGAGRSQVRRLLLGEAVLLGLLGTGIGVPLGLLVQRAQTALLTGLGFVPAEFAVPWRAWIVAVSAGIGTGVAVAGVLAASRRAARVRPLEALRETGAAARVMTASRWFFGVLFLGGAVALAIVSSFAGPVAAIPLSINIAITASIGLSALSPLVVPLVGRLVGPLLRGGPLGTLAAANLRDGVRRSASTAAPLLVLVALLLGLSGTLTTLGAAAEHELRQDVRADLVVTTDGPPSVAGVPGVAVASTELSLRVPLTVTTVDDGEVETDTDAAEAVAVDPADYQRTHHRTAAEGSLADLRGHSIASGEHPLGSVVDARIGDRTVPLRVVAVLPDSFAGADVLLPRALVPPAVAEHAPAHTLVRLDPGADPARVAADLGEGRVQTAEAWVARAAAQQQDTSAGIMTVIMGLAGLYTLIAVVNAVVIGAAERRREFAVARVSGLGRGQVVRAALVESWAVAAIGLFLGGLAAAGAVAGIGAAAVRSTGAWLVGVPWPLLAAVVAGACVVVGVTSVLTSLVATRPRPVSLVGAGE